MSEVLTVADIARLMKVSRQAIRNWWHAGILPEPLLPTPHCPRWPVAEIDRWIAGGCKPACLKAYRKRRVR